MYIFMFFLISLCSRVGSSSNITRSNLFLRDPDEILSPNNNFKLGFFNPPNSTNRYVGISYNTDSDTLEVVWVANRDNPIKGSSGVLKLSEDGHLLVLDGRNDIIWSSNATDTATNSSTADLEDNGNLVLRSDVGEIIWQSFQHPTNALLPHMSFAKNDTNTYNTRRTFRSWKSLSDPSSGRFTIDVNPSRKLFEVFVWDDGRPSWRTGPWNGNIFIGLPTSYNWGQTNLFSNLNGNTNRPILTFLPQPEIPEYLVLAYDGKLEDKAWNETNRKWDIQWRSIETECDVYGTCGAFGRCNPRKLPICRCLDGFEPSSNQEWRNGNWTRGCTRRTPLQCGNDTVTSKPDGFLAVRSIKVPDYAESLDEDDEEGCRRQCLANCLCLAYTFPIGTGCIIWKTSLIDIQDFSATAIDIFIRMAHSELADKSFKWKTILAIVVIVGIITFAVVAFFCWRWRSPHGKRTMRKYILLRNSMPELVSEVEFKDLPLFKFEKLADATNNFHVSNKLGQGGFGPVFKGKLEDGQEVAVKRLSRASGQGLKEFMNEVLLISKLQHRNLVRLLGCCVEGEERLLVYEYMPNKSLDAILFDHLLQEQLDWKTRFNIIKGICWGLLYLHRDSRLRIIHRDLKPSNILLDEDLNPKISDFGMAKIFGDVEDQGNTSRVVGTYGYMSPEYAMKGRVSEKLDIYSFGVMLLEIISGRRNGSFKDVDEVLSISEHAWELWNDNNVFSLIDPNIYDPCFQEEISKCIHLGLLCVQEFPEDRPTISTVISMLDSEILDLPCPMQPGFTRRRNSFPTMNTPNREPNCSINNVSITISGGR